jgi:general secretion pathway protein F
MPQFQFKARDAQGVLVEGVVESPDRPSALRQIEQRRCVPFRVVPIAGLSAGPVSAAVLKSVPAEGAAPAVVDRSAATPSPAVDRLTHSQRLLFTEQLAYLLSAGMTLDEALSVLGKRLNQGNLRGIIEHLHGALVDGRSFSQALADFPRSFPPLYVNLVQAGEASGALPDILKRLVSHLMAVKSLRDSVRQALLYPAVLSVAGAVLMILFITVLVPQLTGFLAKTGGTLPLPTRILIKVNDLVVGYWWLAAMIGIGGFASYKIFTRSPQGREAWDAFRLKIPGYGRVIQYRFYAQFARTLGTLLHNGVTLLKAVDLLASISENAHLRKQILVGRAELVEGASLSKAMSRQGVFPALMLDMMSVGEQTGRFADTMQMIADVYERELDAQVKIATALIPMVIIIVIALLVGAIVFAIMSAVFSATSGLRGRAG